MNRKKVLICAFAVLCLTGCGRRETNNVTTPGVTPGAVSVTVTAAPTPTATPLPTPSPTPLPTAHVIKSEWLLRSEDGTDQSLWLEYSYDDYGRRIRKQDFLSDTYDGTSYEYADDGRVNWFRYCEDQISEKGAWVFDENGNATQIIHIDMTSDEETVVFQDFDMAGNLSRTFSNYINEYDEEGRLIKTTQKRGDTPESTTEYLYDEQGCLQQKDVRDRAGNLVTQTTYIPAGTPKEFRNLTATEAETISYVYSHDRLIGFLKYDQVHDRTNSFLVKYNAHGDVETISEYDADGVFLSGHRYLYEDIVITEGVNRNQHLDYPYYDNASAPHTFWDDWQ